VRPGTRGRYAVTALVDIAAHVLDGVVALATVAERQGISRSYHEQLFVELRGAGIVGSVRGPGGGYRLARPPREVTVGEVLNAMGESLSAMGCGMTGDRHCAKLARPCLTHDLWERLSSMLHVFPKGVTPADPGEGRVPPCPAPPGLQVSGAEVAGLLIPKA